jgi:hypothetical protein
MIFFKLKLLILVFHCLKLFAKQQHLAVIHIHSQPTFPVQLNFTLQAYASRANSDEGTGRFSQHWRSMKLCLGVKIITKSRFRNIFFE